MSDEPSPNYEAIQWETFRFPTRKPSWVKMEGEDAAPSSFSSPEEERLPEAQVTPHVPGEWYFHRKSMSLRHREIGRKIQLRDCNTVVKIIRLMATMENDPRLDGRTIGKALDAASQACFGLSFEDMIMCYTQANEIPWPTMLEDQGVAIEPYVDEALPTPVAPGRPKIK